MSKLNPPNERIKRDYFRFLKEARGKSESTVDAVRKAVARFEDYTGARDFKTFRREQAIGFKERLAETSGQRTGESLSLSTQSSTLGMLREFFTWLAWQPGFKSKIHVPDIEYFSPSIRNSAAARAVKLREFPSVEQVRAVIANMPTGNVVDRRNRALIAMTLLTGIRDRAMVSLSLRHIDMTKSPPLVRQEPDRVETKFAKSINTYFFPVGDDLKQIVADWVDELRTQRLFGPNDPLFPRTKVGVNDDTTFCATGVERVPWSDASPVRTIFRQAFARAGLPYYPPAFAPPHAWTFDAGGLPVSEGDQGLEPESRPRKRRDDADLLRDDRSSPAGRGYRGNLARTRRARWGTTRENPRLGARLIQGAGVASADQLGRWRGS
jgi:site-specific recombinase XerD